MLVSVSGAGVARGVIADAPGSPAPAAAVGSWRRSRARSRTENGGGLHPWGGGNDGLWIAIMPIGAYGGPVREFFPGAGDPSTSRGPTWVESEGGQGGCGLERHGRGR